MNAERKPENASTIPGVIWPNTISQTPSVSTAMLATCITSVGSRPMYSFSCAVRTLASFAAAW